MFPYIAVSIPNARGKTVGAAVYNRRAVALKDDSPIFILLGFFSLVIASKILKCDAR